MTGEKQEGTKVDRRVARTKQAIAEAFERLVLVTDYQKITVSAIAKEANINRKTFYLHYDSVDDLLDSLAKEFSRSSFESLQERGVFDERSLDIDAVAHALGEMYREARLLNPIFMRKLPIDHVVEASQDQWEKTIARERERRGLPPMDNLDYYAHFTLCGLLKIYEHWYETDNDTPFEDIAHIAARAALGGINGLLEK